MITTETQELIDQGRYQEAAEALAGEWPGLCGVSPSRDPELLLALGRIGTVLGASEQTPGAQEAAKDHLTRAETLFGDDPRRLLARVYLGVAYWRSGQSEEALIAIESVLAESVDDETRFSALLAKTVAESGPAALDTLKRAKTLLDHVRPVLKAKYYGQRGTILRTLPDVIDHIDEVIECYTAASVYFEECGNRSGSAGISNNLAGILTDCQRYPEAHAAVDRAIAVWTGERDKAQLAQAFDQKARVFLAESRPYLAFNLSRRAVDLLLDTEQVDSLKSCLETNKKTLEAITAQQTPEAEKEKIRRALEVSKGSTQKAAEILGMSQPGLAYKIKTKYPELQTIRKTPRVRRWKSDPRKNT